LEASANQLSTALHWLSGSLAAERREGRGLDLASAAQLGGPVRALSLAILNLNDGITALLRQAELDLREKIAKEPPRALIQDGSESFH